MNRQRMRSLTGNASAVCFFIPIAVCLLFLHIPYGSYTYRSTHFPSFPRQNDLNFAPPEPEQYSRQEAFPEVPLYSRYSFSDHLIRAGHGDRVHISGNTIPDSSQEVLFDPVFLLFSVHHPYPDTSRIPVPYSIIFRSAISVLIFLPVLSDQYICPSIFCSIPSILSRISCCRSSKRSPLLYL